MGHVIGKSVGAHGHDGHAHRVGAVHGADDARGLVAVHVRHHDVHEHQIERARCGGGERIHGLAPIGRGGNVRAGLVKHELRDLAVQFVVLYQQDGHARKRDVALLVQLFVALLCVEVDDQRQRDDARGAHVKFAIERDGAAHQLRQLLGDDRAQARARRLRLELLHLAAERLEQVLLEIFAHANAGVGHRDAVHGRGAFRMQLFAR